MKTNTTRTVTMRAKMTSTMKKFRYIKGLTIPRLLVILYSDIVSTSILLYQLIVRHAFNKLDIVRISSIYLHSVTISIYN